MSHAHTITITGPASRASGLSSHVVRDLLDVLVRGAEQSLRFRLEGRSTARGTAPSWLRPASDFTMVDLARTEGAHTFRVSAPALIETMPETFHQADLFDDLDPRRSPLDLFEDALQQAIEERADSEAFDQPLLETCSALRAVLSEGVESISIRNGRVVHVDANAMERVTRLSRLAFAQRKVRLAGRLEIIRYSDCRFTLVLDDGSKVPGTARELGAEALRDGFGKNVVVTGVAEFRPSGRILRVEAEAVEPARESDLKLFSVVPRPLLAPPLRELPDEDQRGLPALLGKWPGDEPIELLLAELKSVS